MDPALRDLATAILVFARVGGCLMVMPGFAGLRIPVRVRFAAAAAATLALLPLVGPAADEALGEESDARFLAVMLSEILGGLAIGLMARLFFLALEAMTMAAAMSIGISGMTPPVDEGEAATPLVTLVSLSALLAVVLADLHVVTLVALADSYQALRPASLFDAGATLQALLRVVSQAFLVALQVGAPLIVYGLLANLGFALLGKVAPQMAVYFVAAPFVAGGGLLLLLAVVKLQVGLAASSFFAWFGHG